MMSLLNSAISPSNLKPEVGEDERGESGDIGGRGDVGSEVVFRGSAESVEDWLVPGVGPHLANVIEDGGERDTGRCEVGKEGENSTRSSDS